jgi:hypothetical protein
MERPHEPDQRRVDDGRMRVADWQGEAGEDENGPAEAW